MDDVRVGAVMRAVRIRRRLRQADVADAAGISRAMVSMIESGHLEQMSLRSIRRVGAALGVSVPFSPRWRGGEIARLLDARHAALVTAIVQRLIAASWEVRPELTFAVFGENGALDVMGWRASSRALLVVEAKPVIFDLQDTLSTLDRKRRLAPRLARELGWRPLLVGTVLAMPGESQARHAVEEFGPVVRAAYPAGSLEVRKWIRAPQGDLRGLWFLSDVNPGNARQRSGGALRVRAGRHDAVGPRPRSDDAQERHVGPDDDHPDRPGPGYRRQG